MSIQDPELEALLFRLELQLMDPVFRKDRDKVSALLADDFCEFGSSGRVWSKASILELLATEPMQSAPVVEEFQVKRIAPDAALITYHAVRPDQMSRRSSLWVLGNSGWQIVFHQGTSVK